MCTHLAVLYEVYEFSVPHINDPCLRFYVIFGLFSSCHLVHFYIPFQHFYNCGQLTPHNYSLLNKYIICSIGGLFLKYKIR